MMDDILNFDITTTPGEVAYQEASEKLASIFVLSIISEGYKEEPQYLKYLQGLCRQKGSVQLVIHIVNRHYRYKKDSAGHNHPLKRLNDLLDWKANHVSIDGYENNDEYWLICDRDVASFTSNQYDKLVARCREEH